jgi:succinate dehydrogenase hydrophobic anchor subunit
MLFYPFRLYIKHLPNQLFLGFSAAVNIFLWLWLLVQIRPQNDLIFLHYNTLFGVDFTGEWWKVYYLPAIGILIIAINMFLGMLLFNKDKFISYILLAISLICQIFLAICGALLVFLNV